MHGYETPWGQACRQLVDRRAARGSTHPPQPGWAASYVVGGGDQEPTVCIACVSVHLLHDSEGEAPLGRVLHPQPLPDVRSYCAHRTEPKPYII